LDGRIINGSIYLSIHPSMALCDYDNVIIVKSMAVLLNQYCSD